MNVTRDVIVDLMPLYLAGEGSPATRALVEEYLKGDRELAERVRTLGSRGLEGAGATTLRPDSELESLRRARQLIGAMRWLFALGLSLTVSALAMSFTFRGGRLVDFHFVMRDAPLPLGTLFVFGLGCLTWYFMLRRRLRITMR